MTNKLLTALILILILILIIICVIFIASPRRRVRAKICEHCGNYIPFSAAICPRCGRRVYNSSGWFRRMWESGELAVIEIIIMLIILAAAVFTVLIKNI